MSFGNNQYSMSTCFKSYLAFFIVLILSIFTGIQTPSSFDGGQAHWAALASSIQNIAGDFLRISDANDLPQLTSMKGIKTSPVCWCQPPRTHVVREYLDYKGVPQPQAQSFRDVAFSYQ